MRTRIPDFLLGCAVLILTTGCSEGRAQGEMADQVRSHEAPSAPVAWLGTAEYDRSTLGAIVLVDESRSIGAVYFPPEIAPVCDLVVDSAGGLVWRSEPTSLGYLVSFAGTRVGSEYHGRLEGRFGSNSFIDQPSTWRQVEIGGGPSPLFDTVWSHLWVSERTGDQGGFEVVLVALLDGTPTGLFLASEGRLGKGRVIRDITETEEGVRIQNSQWTTWLLSESPEGAALERVGRGRVETLTLKGGLWEELEAAMDRCPVEG